MPNCEPSTPRDGAPADVLYLAQAGTLEPWYGDFARALEGRASVRLLDPAGSFVRQVEGARVVVDQGGSVGTPAMYDAAAASGVQLWQVLGTGLDHVDVDGIRRRGLRVANTPGLFSAVALAEHAMLLMLCFAKRLRVAEANVRAGRMYEPLSSELAGARLVLYGLGASARELARRASAFGLEVVAVDAAPPSGEILRELGVRSCDPPEGLASLLPQADYLSIHVPLTPSTRGAIGAAELALLRPSAVLVNVARGEIVVEAALVDALERGAIAGAGLDAFELEPLPPDHPFLRLPNVVATPHTAGASSGTSVRRGQACADNVLRVLQGLPPLYEVAGAPA